MEHLVVAVARFVFLIPGCRSLKEKRVVVRKVKDRLAAHHNVSVAEVGAQDDHDRAVLAMALVGSDATVAGSALRKILDGVQDWHLAPMVDRRVEIVTFGDTFGSDLPGFPDRW